jgi:hypothetical protein
MIGGPGAQNSSTRSTGIRNLKRRRKYAAGNHLAKLSLDRLEELGLHIDLAELRYTAAELE